MKDYDLSPEEYMDEEIERSDEEMIDLFREQKLTTKDDILTQLWLETMSWQKNEQNRLSEAGLKILLKVADAFKKKVEKAILFNELEPWWVYSVETDSTGMTLLLEHYADHYDSYFDREGNYTGSFIDESFEILKVHTRLLTIEEYASTYGVETVTVRQWIRRGKLRTAIKYGREWRIPELTDVPGRGYKMGQYEWSEKLTDVPEEFSFLSHCDLITLEQSKKDKTLYIASFTSKEDDGNHHMVCELDVKERERLELYLISNPLIRYISDTVAYTFG